MKRFILATFLALTFTTPPAYTADPIGALLASARPRPKDVFEFRAALLKAGIKLETALVANRGFHNPTQGSFSMFEMATRESSPVIRHGDFFFGHFTTVDSQNHLAADQDPKKGSLMIEAFAWDARKGYYNFYELRGDGSAGQWFYRGDSADAFADNRLLHRQPDPAKPVFGEKMRCSACHSAGGPVMKEIYPPHNDWWTPERKLDLGGRELDAKIKSIFATLVPAHRLAKSVEAGLKKLESSSSFQSMKTGLSTQEILRPLFCPMEVNFQSDFLSNSENASAVRIPTDFFVDSRLVSKKTVRKGISLERSAYESALSQLGSHFPESNESDADHAWLTPVKAKSDKLAVQALIATRIIDEEFVADVLAVDFKNPVVSKNRCLLLRLLPNDTSDWKTVFKNNLARSRFPAAQELLQNLSESSHNLAFYKARSEAYLKQPKNVVTLVKQLDRRRQEIKSSEISKNPKGQILEPGFRVIFPELQH